MADKLDFRLHDAQLEIFNSNARFKVVAAGRRFGKSYLAAVTLILEALKETNEDGYSLLNEEVYYVAPTFEQAKKIIWPLLKDLAKHKSEGGLIESTVENTAVMTLINGRRISIKGADRPDSLRGVGLSFVVLDEYAFMKEGVWSLIIRPALARAKGGALFIGTPDGKNHFYDLWNFAAKHEDEGWDAWQFESLKNPTLDPAEIANAINSSKMSVAAAKQEFGASFSSGGGLYLPETSWKFSTEPEEGDYFIAVDLAGFTTEGSVKKGQLKVRDEHAISIVKCGPTGWWIKDIISGRWDVRETALRIMKAYQETRPIKLGIEKGALKNAVMPYLEDQQRKFNRYFPVYDLVPGGRKVGSKEDRIRWALEGRLEKGLIYLNEDEHVSSLWQRKLIEQASDFPSPLSHDDMIDSLSYIDQLADVIYYLPEVEEWQALDSFAGF